MEKFEQKKSRIEDPNFIEQIRQQFADEWEDLVTGEGTSNEDELGFAQKIREGKKIPEHPWLRSKLVKISQDYRLTPEEIDDLMNIFLE